MTLKEKILNSRRTLLELRTGILALGLLGQLVGIFFYPQKGVYSLSLWIGIGLALAATEHMYRTLDKALDYDEKNANRRIYSGYVVRYSVFAVVLIAACVVTWVDPIVLFCAYFSMKVAAWITPFTHKIYNRILHVQDPEPQTEEEYQKSLEALKDADAAIEAEAKADAELEAESCNEAEEEDDFSSEEKSKE